MSKLRPSTFICACVMAPVTMPDSIGVESSKPRRAISPATRSEAKMRIRSSSSELKNRELPGPPVQPAESGDPLPEQDVDPAAGHVRRESDGTALAGVRDDQRLALVVLRVQDL